MKPYLQTARQAEIVQYADEHPEMSQEAIASVFGIGRTSVSRIMVMYRPDRPRLMGGVESKLNNEIRDYKRTHPDMSIMDIAFDLHQSKYRVQNAIKGMEAAKSGRKRKHKSDEYTIRTCLMCGKSFKSTWIGHRRCHDCQERVEYQYVPDHRVFIEGHGRV